MVRNGIRSLLILGLASILGSCGGFAPGSLFGGSNITLTVIAEDGDIEVTPKKATYVPGDVVTLTALPTPTSHFVQWSEGLTGIETSRELTLTTDTTVRAHFFVPSRGNNFYVAPSGTSTGTGTEANPWDLVTALNHPSAVQPGDTIWLLDGNYVGRFTSNLKGTAALPIVVRAKASAKARLDGNSPLPNIVLSQSIGTAAAGAGTPIPVTDNTQVKVGDMIRFENETIHIYNFSGGQFTGTRGYNGSPVAAHAAGTPGTLLRGKIPTLQINGEHTWFWDLDITDTGTNRVSAETGSDAYDLDRGELRISGKRIKLINCLVHDLRQGITAQGLGEDFEAYGNIIFNNGWSNPSNGAGHGIYTQNATDGVKVYRQNIVLPQFGLGLQQYGSDNAKLDHFRWDENVFVLGRTLFGGQGAANDLHVTRNMSYGQLLEIGYSGDGNKDARVIGNYLDGLAIKYWTGLSVFDNLLFASIRRSDTARFMLYATTPATYDYSLNKMDRNVIVSDQLYAGNRRAVFYGPRVPDAATHAEWTALTGYEENGTLIPQLRPAQNQIFFLRNAFDPKIAVAVIYNWQGSSTVSVDTKGFLKPGDVFELRQALDYESDIENRVAGGVSFSVAMTGRSTAIPYGWSSPLETPAFPEFGVFVLRKP